MCAGSLGVDLNGIEATDKCCSVFGEMSMSKLEEAASYDTSLSKRS